LNCVCLGIDEAAIGLWSPSFFGTPLQGGGLGGSRSRRAGAEAAATAAAVRAGEGLGAAAMEGQRWLPLEANPEVSAARVGAGGRGQEQRGASRLRARL
jgi:hypothetical protein